MYTNKSYADMLETIDTEYEYCEMYDAERAEIVDNVETVKRELNRKLMLANKYGYDEYADELAHLLEKLDAFRKARK